MHKLRDVFPGKMQKDKIYIFSLQQVRYYFLNPACYAEINNSYCQLYQIKTFYHRLVVILQKRSAVQTRQGYGGNKQHETLFQGHVAISVDELNP